MPELMLPPAANFGMTSFSGSVLAPADTARLLAQLVAERDSITLDELADVSGNSVATVVALLPLMRTVRIVGDDRSALHDANRRGSVVVRST